MINRLAKRIILIFNWIAILLLGLGFLAGKISPQHASILVIFGLGFHVLATLNLVFVIFWVFFRKYYFLYSLLALLAVYKPLTNTFNLALKKETFKKSSSFSLLSYNVKVFDLYNWRKNKQSRNEIFSFVRSLSPDIACFQEYFNTSTHYFPVHDSLIHNQKFKYSHIFYSDQLPNGHNFGIATYSKFPIVNKANISFGNTHNLAIASDIKIKKDTLRIINCHLESVKFLKEDYVFMDSLPALSDEKRIKGAKGIVKRLKNAATIRANQIQLIRKYIENSPYPVMLCGDFNDVPASYTYQKLSEGLNDSFQKAPWGLNGTYPRFFPPLRIDFILYQETLSCEQFKLFKTNLSDHYPVFGTYLLP
jgi:endonuclease/exonuclease/phosphatase family metal-dependent hydrolase